MSSEDSEADIGELAATINPLAETRAHWSLFLPAILVAALYGCAWLILDWNDLAGGALARLVFLVLVAAPPLLWGHAFLRFYSIGVALTETHVLVARGWPHHEARQIDLGEIESATVRVSPLARMLGSGSLHLRMWDGTEIDAYDLKRPDRLAALIRERIRTPAA
ncbi:MAG TPA: PH domain-containing protein [Hyphomicrobiales bacterium]|nr:PH domain-containing protein [Rhodobiaceae bacterium]HXK54197.1 PH domain-containing protein [Hyphomicrobiales bacterium]